TPGHEIEDDQRNDRRKHVERMAKGEEAANPGGQPPQGDGGDQRPPVPDRPLHENASVPVVLIFQLPGKVGGASLWKGIGNLHYGLTFTFFTAVEVGTFAPFLFPLTGV